MIRKSGLTHQLTPYVSTRITASLAPSQDLKSVAVFIWSHESSYLANLIDGQERQDFWRGIGNWQGVGKWEFLREASF